MKLPIFTIYFLGKGGTCDGQYIAAKDFAERLAERLETFDELGAAVTWDPSHFVNLAVTDVLSGKGGMESSAHLKRFITRANVFHDELNRGKGHATLMSIAAQEKTPALAPCSFAKQR